MLRIVLKSTSLNAMAYQDQQALLTLEFRSGAIYRYFGVPGETYRGLLLAESKGTYFNRHIRNRFSYTKIRREEPPAVAIPTFLSCPNQ
jgi:hypothetical protein